MSPVAAVASCFRQYVGFSGRARRSEWWWFVLFDTILYVASYAAELALGGEGYVAGGAFLLTFLPYLAVSVRRLHDTGRGGWWVLILWVPLIGILVFLVWATADSAGDNEWGPSPKARSAPLG